MTQFQSQPGAETGGMTRLQSQSGAETGGMIRLRPHHGMCLLNFRGMGYSPEFTEKMTAVSELLRREPETAVSVSDGTDDLCSVCPHCVNGKCTSDNPAVFDRRVLKAAGVHAGDVVTWKDFSGKTEVLNRTALKEICAGCRWLQVCIEIAGPNAAGPEIAGPNAAGPEIAGPNAADPDIAGSDMARPVKNDPG